MTSVSGCCNDDCSLDVRQDRQRGTLRVVLGINALMFLVIAGAALYGGSSALLADSLDNLGDALTYGLSLYVVSRGAAAKARVALFKGGLIVLAAAGGGWLTGTGWPDTLVALALALFLLRSGIGVIASARRELRAAA